MECSNNTVEDVEFEGVQELTVQFWAKDPIHFLQLRYCDLKIQPVSPIMI